jgi:DNA-binding FrmR family transcriptional regulator
MRFDNDSVPEALLRLRRIEGQIGGIVRMIEQGRDCDEVIQQLAAARRAMDRAGLRLLSTQLERCMSDAAGEAGSGYDHERFERLFLMLT